MTEEQKKLLRKLQYPEINKKTVMLLLAGLGLFISFGVSLILSAEDLFSKLIVAGFILSLCFKIKAEVRKTPTLQGVRTIFKIIKDDTGKLYVQAFEDDPVARIPTFIETKEDEDDVVLPYGRCGDPFLLVLSGGIYYALPGGLTIEDNAATDK